MTKKHPHIVWLIIIAFVFVYVNIKWENDEIAERKFIFSISKMHAVTICKEKMEWLPMLRDYEWGARALFVNPEQNDLFKQMMHYEVGLDEYYEMVGKYLPSPSWNVRLNSSANNSKLEYTVSNKGHIVQFEVSSTDRPVFQNIDTTACKTMVASILDIPAECLTMTFSFANAEATIYEYCEKHIGNLIPTIVVINTGNYISIEKYLRPSQIAITNSILNAKKYYVFETVCKIVMCMMLVAWLAACVNNIKNSKRLRTILYKALAVLLTACTIWLLYVAAVSGDTKSHLIIIAITWCLFLALCIAVTLNDKDCRIKHRDIIIAGVYWATILIVVDNCTMLISRSMGGVMLGWPRLHCIIGDNIGIDYIVGYSVEYATLLAIMLAIGHGTNYRLLKERSAPIQTFILIMVIAGTMAGISIVTWQDLLIKIVRNIFVVAAISHIYKSGEVILLPICVGILEILSIVRDTLYYSQGYSFLYTLGSICIVAILSYIITTLMWGRCYAIKQFTTH